ncbi:MAG: proline--tRNA ligase [Deltaproteobacteria bacterium]|nr:proline--tRNA ligase [Deltaproteobacteria bacterium]
MLLSQIIGQRTKEVPREALLVSHAYLLRGGYIRQVANGIYSLLPLGLRVIRKIENIVREEMNAIDGQEVLMPVVLPKELLDESGRYERVGSELMSLKDRAGHDMVLAMTHEEAAVHLARNEANSYRSYPFMLYQIQTKFRDEPHSRGGLIRTREFTMKDAYSFHRDQASLDEFYERCAYTYNRIFSKCGIPEVKKVQSDTGMMGGGVAHEYMLLSNSGEDTTVTCNECDYMANLEVARCKWAPVKQQPSVLKKVHTPGKHSIRDVAAFLNVLESQIAKVVFYESDSVCQPLMVLIRGDSEVNENKLTKIIGVKPAPASENTIFKTGAVAGFASPIGIHDCRVIVDESLVAGSNFVAGANETDYHYINFDLNRDAGKYEINDIATVKDGDLCPLCGGTLSLKRGIEVGNIFQLGTQYTDRMKMRYLDEGGNECTPIMGCYCIGLGRLMASVIEARHDKFGPIWPHFIAPFSVHIITIDLKEAEKEIFSTPIYNELCAKGIETVYDDREERAGVKFADADLIGAPMRLIFSGKNLDSRTVEWKSRDGSGKGTIQVDQVMSFVSNY